MLSAAALQREDKSNTYKRENVAACKQNRPDLKLSFRTILAYLPALASGKLHGRS